MNSNQNPVQRWCPVCNKAVHYHLATPFSAYWVHSDSGDWLDQTPVAHDVNAYAPTDLLKEDPNHV